MKILKWCEISSCRIVACKDIDTFPLDFCVWHVPFCLWQEKFHISLEPFAHFFTYFWHFLQHLFRRCGHQGSGM